MKQWMAAMVLGLGASTAAQAYVVVPVIPVVGALPVLGPVAGPVLNTALSTVASVPLLGPGGVSLPDAPVIGPTLLTPVLQAVGQVVGSLPGGSAPALPALPGLPQ